MSNVYDILSTAFLLLAFYVLRARAGSHAYGCTWY